MHNEARFPVISKVARKYLAVPATSVPRERIFSAAGILVIVYVQTQWTNYYLFVKRKFCLKSIKSRVTILFFRYVHVFRWIKELKLPRFCTLVEINIMSQMLSELTIIMYLYVGTSSHLYMVTCHNIN
jgi:hypothetical protein